MHTPRRTAVLRAVTRLGSLRFLLPASLVAAGALILLERGRSARVLGLAMLAGWAASSAAKRVFRRRRPDLWPALATEPTHSFPSQHALLATVFFGGVGWAAIRLLPDSSSRPALAALLAFLAAAIILAVAFSRVYLGAHWTTDVVAGLGVGLVLLVFWIFAGQAGRLRVRISRSRDLMISRSIELRTIELSGNLETRRRVRIG